MEHPDLAPKESEYGKTAPIAASEPTTELGDEIQIAADNSVCRHDRFGSIGPMNSISNASTSRTAAACSDQDRCHHDALHQGLTSPTAGGSTTSPSATVHDVPPARICGRISSDPDALELLHQKVGWTPGADQIRPSASVRARKDVELSSALQHIQRSCRCISATGYNSVCCL